MTVEHGRALDLLEALAANGGNLQLQPRGDGLTSFLISYEPGADRQRCRQLMADLKADARVLRAAVALLSTRSAA